MAASLRTGTWDTTPHIRAAGRHSSKPEGAAVCLQPDENAGERPETPPEIKKYRKSTRYEPGKVVKHYGLADDKVPLRENQAFGMKKEKTADDNVASVIRATPESAMLKWHQERKEDIYASTKREPLGKPMSRGYVIPDELGTTKAFGSFIDAKYRSRHPETKDVIFNAREGLDENEQTHNAYVKTHGDYGPGEQRRRNYDWDNTPVKDPANHKFGVTDTEGRHCGGVAALLNHGEDDRLTAKIVDKKVEDFKAIDADELGRPKSLCLGMERNEDHVFGMPTRRKEEWDAAQLIRGGYSEEQQQPDADLGRSVRRNYTNGGDTHDRIFGVPTIRRDVVRHGKIRSVADNQNYGDEPDAARLLKPLPGADRGVTEEDYLQAMSRPEMYAFMNRAGIDLEDGTFEAVFDRAMQLEDYRNAPEGGEDRCSLEAFRRVLHAT
ncbi:hypothetical protein KFL_000590290 [Klebsormidium nitens]|uniref:EFHB C-terminal EF-hand domain-containing protein n=1 Tax=Klebsormidium nitens TaxID=105231 RepID=A0A1Y1HVY5_KLENI|nr:hypothetical protein KFL_000590290 [Klebsormidium nitens]|eukprot:GAQ80676.1 hypothetical protein KFL_000590290 [Klebsormidium nitens]